RSRLANVFSVVAHRVSEQRPEVSAVLAEERFTQSPVRHDHRVDLAVRTETVELSPTQRLRLGAARRERRTTERSRAMTARRPRRAGPRSAIDRGDRLRAWLDDAVGATSPGGEAPLLHYAAVLVSRFVKREASEHRRPATVHSAL